MATIQDYLSKILKSRYGREVRQAIHDAIHQCYSDGSAGAIDLEARESIDALNSNFEWVGGLTDTITLSTTAQTATLAVPDKTIYETMRLIFTIDVYTRFVCDISPRINSGFEQRCIISTAGGTLIPIAIDYSDIDTIKIRLLSEYTNSIVLHAIRFHL